MPDITAYLESLPILSCLLSRDDPRDELPFCVYPRAPKLACVFDLGVEVIYHEPKDPSDAPLLFPP